MAAEITDECGGEIIIGATHTHSDAPAFEIFVGGADRQCMEAMRQGIITAVRKARGNLRAASLKHRKGLLENLAFNRRFIMSDGTVETHPLKGDPHILQPEGPDSKDLHVIAAESPDGKILGGIVIFGCHSTVMERGNALISSDFPGKTTEYLERAFGSPFLYFQGACGNICQVNPRDISKHELGKSWAEKMGREISGKVIELAKSEGVSLEGRMKTSSATINLPRRKVHEELAAWSEKHRKINAVPPELSDYGTELYGHLPDSKVSLEALFKTPFWADFYSNEIKTLAHDFQRSPEMPFTIKIIALGSFAIVALPCELFIEWQNRIIEASPFKNTVVVELANGWNGYVPTEEAFARQGGYETKEVTSTMLVPEAGQIMYEEVIRMLKEMVE